MNKSNKSPAITGSTLSQSSTSRASFGGMHLWGYAIAAAAELRLVREQRRISEKYYDIAKRDHEFWLANYKQKELDYANEAFAIPEAVPNYNNYSNTETHNLPNILKQEHFALESIPLRQIGQRWRVDIESRKLQMLARAAGRVIAYRVNYAFAERDNIKRMARRFAAVNVGVQAGNAATASLGQATGRLIESLNQVQSSVSALRSGFGQALGFNRRRAEEGSGA